MTEKSITWIRKFLVALLAAAGGFLAFKYVLPWLLPFILAFGFAMLLEPLVLFLRERFHIKRGFAAAFIVTLFLTLFAGLLILIGTRVVGTLGRFLSTVPNRMSHFSLPFSGIELGLRRFTAAMPSEFSAIGSNMLESIQEQTAQLPARLYNRLFDSVSQFASKAPAFLLFFGMLALSLYFISSSFPTVKAFVLRQLPRRLRMKIGPIKEDVLSTLKGWLTAQLKLMALTFSELSAAFLFMRLENAVLLAAGISLIDALPVFGIGTVMIPWTIFSILFGEYRRAIFLMLVYTLVSLVRSCLEPKLLGNQMGLHPAATLVAVYAGWRFFSVPGMLFFPIGLMLLKQFNDRGWIRLWK